MTTSERFETYHSKHPELYKSLVANSKDLRARGFRHYSIKTLICIARWHLEITPDVDETYRISDAYTSRYARLIMSQEPELTDFFHLRPLKTL